MPNRRHVDAQFSGMLNLDHTTLYYLDCTVADRIFVIFHYGDCGLHVTRLGKNDPILVPTISALRNGILAAPLLRNITVPRP